MHIYVLISDDILLLLMYPPRNVIYMCSPEIGSDRDDSQLDGVDMSQDANVRMCYTTRSCV